jgi:hypothetical protein
MGWHALAELTACFCCILIGLLFDPEMEAVCSSKKSVISLNYTMPQLFMREFDKNEEPHVSNMILSDSQDRDLEEHLENDI